MKEDKRLLKLWFKVIKFENKVKDQILTSLIKSNKLKEILNEE